MLQQFRFRADLYNSWDQRLGHRTRFFRAAATTNALLGDLCTYRWFVSQSTLDFLSGVGETLQGVNLKTAHSISEGRFCGADLDNSMVTLEQAVLERELRTLAAVNESAYRRTVRQIDRLLNSLRLGIFLTVSTCPNLRLYTLVLRDVASELGRPATFALQHDRICIGRHLMRQLNLFGPL